MSEAPKFSFGGPPTTSGSTGSPLFNTANNTGSGGSLFGGGNTKTDGSSFSFSGFGTPPTASKPEEKKSSLFGSAPDGGSGSLFGQQGGGSTFPGFKLNDNQKPNESKSTGNHPSLFSGGFSSNLQTPAKTTATTSPGANQTSGLFGASTGGAPSIFGNPSSTPSGVTTPAPATSAPAFSFGGPSTTPAGPPPSNTFGTGTGTSGGLFGNTTAQQGGGLFGQKQGQQAQQTTTASTSSGQPATTSNLFGNSTGTGSGGLFSNKPTTTGPSIFQGFNKPSETSNDISTAPTTTVGAPKSFFNIGQNSSAPTPSTAAPSLLGNPPTSSQAAPPLFSVPASTSSESSASKPVFPFPSQNTATSSAPPSAPASTAADTGAPKPFLGIGAPAASQAPSTGATGSGGLFQFKPTTSAASGSGSSSATATSGQPAPSLFQGLGTTSTSQAPTTTTAAAPTTTAPATTGPGTSTLGASTAGPVPPAQSRLRNKTMDEILTRWASDLTKYTKEFKTQAETVAMWDQVLVDNMSKISKLYTQTATAEKQTASVEMQLTAVENQQNELDSWLTKYEHEVDEMLAKNGPSQEVGGPDQERERTFKLAERLAERLEDMSKDLETMVEEVNSANASLNKNTKADEPVIIHFQVPHPFAGH
jgi:nuclear pore complex protein Nup62